jgi:glycosyltransferase involved in cell wall biosynthesis
MLPDRVALATFGFVIHSATQLAQQRAVRELVPRVRASIVHEPIPVSPRTPSMMHDVGVPVVIGPMNGGMRYPPGFRHLEGHFERHIVGLARGTAFVANALIPGKRRATALLVANSRTREALPRGTCPRVIELVENGVDLSLFCRALRPTTPRSRVRFVFVGRLIRLKAVDLLLEAIAIASRQADIELHVVGDGPERAALEARCGRLSLADRVLFHGFVAQERCPSLLDDADALVMPSLLDCGGAVVLEAMAMGLPVIATRWGGPADYVDETTGILVAPIAPSALVEGFANAIVKLARSPELRAQMGVAARSRVLERYDWERKIDRILSIYREVQGAAVRGATGR